ncbi:MAG: hypothetical protein WAV10_02655 [Minisyncoccia bacterium]
MKSIIPEDFFIEYIISPILVVFIFFPICLMIKFLSLPIFPRAKHPQYLCGCVVYVPVTLNERMINKLMSLLP